MRRIIRYTILGANILAAILLLLSCLSVFVRPEQLWFIAFFGLLFPYLYLLNLAFLVYWLLARRLAILISLSVILAGGAFIGRLIRWPFDLGQKKEISAGNIPQDTLKILSYNVRAFNLYDWAHNKKAAEGILDFISRSEGDIVCFQEFYSRAEKKLSLKGISNFPDIAPHAYLHYYFKDKQGGRYGIATYSRFPIVRRGALTFDNTFNVCIFIDICWNNDTVRIYNNHLQSVRFRKGNYDFIDTVTFSYSEKKLDELKDISTRLKNAYIKRSRQVDLIAAHIRQCPYPVIVCGDFNDTPISYTYQKMRGKLQDAFMESGRGPGSTYRGNIPSFRIDYILHSADFLATDFETPRINYSDHYPVQAKLVQNNPKKSER